MLWVLNSCASHARFCHIALRLIRIFNPIPLASLLPSNKYIFEFTVEFCFTRALLFRRVALCLIQGFRVSVSERNEELCLSGCFATSQTSTHAERYDVPSVTSFSRITRNNRNATNAPFHSPETALGRRRGGPMRESSSRGGARSTTGRRQHTCVSTTIWFCRSCRLRPSCLIAQPT